MLINSCTSAEEDNVRDLPEVRNIIFMIGDGMGLAHVNAAISVSPEPLNLEKADQTGFQTTFSADDYITDSAAGGTAMASGKKTNNGFVGLDPQGNILKSILEIAEEHGLSTGLISTSALTHATPASFIAHDPDRDNYEAIAMDFLKTDIDIFIGGGYNHFNRRADFLSLTDSLKSRSYEIDTTLSSIENSSANKIAGLIAPFQLPYRLDGRGDMLPRASRKAIEILNKNAKGFFLMIEGSQIDWAAHANDTVKMIDETLDFDSALGVVLEFARKDGHTLVLVTADHETGGVTIVGGDKEKREVVVNFSSTSHTAIMVPVFAFGPGSDLFSGVMDNTSLFKKFLTLYGF